MELTNLAEFATYCQEYADDDDLPGVVGTVEQWADNSIQLARQYGGRNGGLDEWIGEAYLKLQADGADFDYARLTRTHEIMTKFWKHGEAFDAWFKSKVIIVQPSTPAQSDQ